MIRNLEQVAKVLENEYSAKVYRSEFERGYNAEIVTGRGMAHIYFIEEGAIIRKPNGTKKTYYEISNGKFFQYINQVINANK